MQPIRHALGALLPKQGRVEEALVEYRADLEFDSLLKRSSRHPDNVCSLSGYHEFLERTGLHELAAVRALARPATQRSLIEFRHHSLRARTIQSSSAAPIGGALSHGEGPTRPHCQETSLGFPTLSE